MGLEALYKPSTGLRGCDFLVCSDASGSLIPPGRLPLLDLLRGRLASPRLFDVASDQIRALRSRMLIGSIERGEVKGLLLCVGVSMRRLGIEEAKLKDPLTDEQAGFSLNYPTDLSRISEKNFDLLLRHGAEACEATLAAYADIRGQGVR